MSVNLHSDQSRQVNWTVREDTDATMTITCTQNSVAYDTTSYTFIAEIYKVGATSALITLTQGSGITNGGATGIITLSLTDTQLNLTPGEYWWRLRTTAPTDNYWFNGKFVVNGYVWDGSTNSEVSVALTIGATNISLAITIAGGSGGGSGTVTSFSAGDLAPLFTTSEATVTTTPALTFAQIVKAANLVFAGPTTGGAANPDFRSLVAADIPNLASVYQAISTALLIANNLSDLANAGTARTNLGLGTLATQNTSYVIGLQDLYIPSVAMWPRTTGGCAALAKTEMATSLVNIQSLDFDQTTQEHAQFTISLPKNWNNGTVTATFYWTAAAGTGDVIWGIQGGAYSNDDALTVALGSAQTVTDTLIATNDLHISPATSAITLAGTPADADFLAFQIYRDISDTLNADAKLLGVVIQLTTDAAVSA